MSAGSPLVVRQVRGRGGNGTDPSASLAGPSPRARSLGGLQAPICPCPHPTRWGGGAAPSLRGSTPAPAPVHREAIDPATRPPSRLLSPWLGQRSPLPQRPGRDTPLQVRPIVGTAAGALLHPTGTREKRAWPGGLAEGRCGPSCCQLGGGKGSRSPGGQGLRASLRERDGQSTGE